MSKFLSRRSIGIFAALVLCGLFMSSQPPSFTHVESPPVSPTVHFRIPEGWQPSIRLKPSALSDDMREFSVIQTPNEDAYIVVSLLETMMSPSEAFRAYGPKEDANTRVSVPSVDRETGSMLAVFSFSGSQDGGTSSGAFFTQKVKSRWNIILKGVWPHELSRERMTSFKSFLDSISVTMP